MHLDDAPTPIWRHVGDPLLFSTSPGQPGRAERQQADVAQLVERNLAKVEVASSSLVVRSEVHSLRGGLAERRGNGLQIRVHGFKSRTHLQPDQQFKTWAIGAAVARFLDTEEVTGSNPVSPTRRALLDCGNAGEEGFFVVCSGRVEGLCPTICLTVALGPRGADSVRSFSAQPM